MKPSLPILLLALITASVLHGAHAATLRLTTVVNGTPVDLAGLDGDGNLLAGPDRQPVRHATNWTLQGDVREALELFRWAPVHRIQRADERARKVTPDRPFRATVQVRHVPEASADLPRELQPLLLDWPEGTAAGGVAVAAWLSEGRVVEVNVLPLPPTRHDQSWGLAVEFSLTAEQAARGQPVLLLWRDGAFLPPQPLFPDANSQRALVAVRLDDLAALDRALAAGARADAVSRDGYSLVHYAAESGAVSCLGKLLQVRKGAANEADKHAHAPLHHACEQGRLAAVQSLLGNRARLVSRESAVASPIILAISGGHAEVVAALLATAPATGYPNRGAGLVQAALNRGDADIAALLLDARAHYDFKAQETGRQLLVSSLRGHLAVVRWLIAHGIDPNTEIRGATALSLAAQANADGDSARVLIEAGAKVDAATKNGVTPLMAAAATGNVAFAQVLLEAGASAQARTDDGMTALHLAAGADSAELAELLIERGADVMAPTQTGATPLEFALDAGAPNAARVLARKGATIHLGHPKSETLLATAVRHDIAEVIEAALRDGWPAKSTFAGIWPAARVAEMFSSKRCLSALIAADATPPDPSQPMPLAAASELDQPIRVVRRIPANDPRSADEVYAPCEVRVSVLIDSEGRPLFPGVVDSPDPRLRSAAIEMVQNVRFAALRRGGEPVAARVQLPVTFAGSEDRVFELERLTKRPVPTFQPPPEYPRALKMAGITGRAEIGFIVDQEGRVRDLIVLNATRKEFADAAMEAISRWKFQPGSIDGRPVNTAMKQPLSFTLSP